MKLALCSAFLLWATTSLGQTLVPCPASCPARYFYERQPLTRSVPSSAPVAGLVGSGMFMGTLKGARVSACAPDGQTFTGTGAFRAYLYVSTGPGVGWYRGDAALDLAVSSNWSGARCVVWPDLAPGVYLPHWVLYTADDVGLDGTASDEAEQDTVLLRIEGTP